MVKKFIFLGMLFLFLFPAPAHSENPGDLRISLIDGDVQINTADTGEWVAASINMPLLDGDRIWVPEGSKAELQLIDGTYVRLNENTSLDVLTVEKHSFQFNINAGNVYVNFAGLTDNLIQIDTPVSSIRAYDRAKFGVDVSEEDFTQVSVFKGEVYAENRNGSTTVTAGRTLSLTGQSTSELSPLGPPNAWIGWNRDRERRLSESSYSRKYLPDDLSPYSYDFDRNGKWVYVRDYGYCWTPTVVVSSGWAPYRMGRWVWMNNDYVWISYEPWGWVPYHYGRWAFAASVGWCWVPPTRGAVYWGPGFVGWVNTPSYVSWVPLAPGEIYYGHGYYGPHSVNITNININKVVIKNVYKNVYVNNAVSVESHDTFVTGRHEPVKVKENPFLREKISVGRPDIRPEKRTAMPVIKEIPTKELPPARIREVHVKELKEKHPLIKERNETLLKRKPPLSKTQAAPRESAPKGKEIEKQKKISPPEKAPAAKAPAKPQELKPSVGTMPEKKKGFAPPSEKAPERPREIRPPAGMTPEKQKKIVPSERIPERPKETRQPAERGVEKKVPVDKETVRPSIEKRAQPREMKPPVEQGKEKSSKKKPSGKEEKPQKKQQESGM